MGTDLQLRQHDIEKFDDRLSKIDKQIQRIETFLKDTHQSEENDRMLMNELYLKSVNDRERVKNKKNELIKREEELLDGPIQKLYNEEIKNLFNATDANALAIENHLRKFYNNELSNYRMPSDSILESSDYQKSVFDYERRNRSGQYIHSQPGYSGSLMETMYSTPDISQLTADALAQKLTPGHSTYDPVLGFSGQKMFSVDIHSNVCEFDIGIAYVTKDSPFLIQKTGGLLTEQNVSNDGESELMRRFYGNIIVSNCTDGTKDLNVKSVIMCSDNEFVNDLGPKFYFRVHRDINSTTKRLYLVLTKYDPYRYYYADDGINMIFEDIFDINVKKALEGFDTIIPNIDINISLKNNSFRGDVFTSMNYSSSTVRSLDSVNFTVEPKSHGIIQLNGIKPTAAPERIYPKKSEPIVIDKPLNTTLSQHADSVYDAIMREINGNEILKNDEKVLVETQTVIGTEKGLNSKIVRIDKIKKIVSFNKTYRASLSVQVGHRVKFPFNVNGTSDVNVVRNVEILKTVAKLTFQYGIDQLKDTDELEFLDIGESFFVIDEVYKIKKGSTPQPFDLISYVSRNGFNNRISDSIKDEMKYQAATFSAYSSTVASRNTKKFAKTIVYKDYIYGIPSLSSIYNSYIAKYNPRTGHISYHRILLKPGIFYSDNYREDYVIQFKNYVYMLPRLGNVYYSINLDTMERSHGEISFISNSNVNSNHDTTGVYYAAGDSIIQFPYRSRNHGSEGTPIIEIRPNMKTGAVTFREVKTVSRARALPYTITRQGFYDSYNAVRIGSSIYCIPHHAENRILEIRFTKASSGATAHFHNIPNTVEDRSFSGHISNNMDFRSTWWLRWRNVVAIKDRYLYAIPWEWRINDSTRTKASDGQRWILKFDATNKTFSKLTINNPNYIPDGDGQFNDAIVVQDRYIYCIPSSANKVVKIDTDTDDVSFISIPDNIRLSAWLKFSHGVLLGKDIFCITAHHATEFSDSMIIDTTNDRTSTFFLGEGINTSPIFGHAVAYNDKLYMFTWTAHGSTTGGVVVSKKKERDYVEIQSLQSQENKLITYHTSTTTSEVPNKIKETNIDKEKLLLKKNYFSEINNTKEPVRTTVQIHNRLK